MTIRELLMLLNGLPEDGDVLIQADAYTIYYDVDAEVYQGNVILRG